MIDFTFHNPTRIHFGRNSLSHLADEVKLCCLSTAADASSASACTIR